MSGLAHQRCFNHLTREAAARCRTCQQHFCRECVTEHDGRLVCAACLQREAATPVVTRHWGRWLWRSVQVVSSLALLWGVFYLLGLALLHIPSEVHEGTVWRHFSWLRR